MKKILQKKVIIVLALVLVAGGAGLYVSGMIGGTKGDAAKKSPVLPVVLQTNAPEGFTVNLADSDAQAYAVFNVALEPEPLTPEEMVLWLGSEGGGHGGGATEPPGPAALASYPKFRHAVITTTMTFTSKELLAPGGTDKLRQALLAKLDEIAERDAAEYAVAAKKDEVHDPTHPPYHILDVYLQNFAVQVSE